MQRSNDVYYDIYRVSIHGPVANYPRILLFFRLYTIIIIIIILFITVYVGHTIFPAKLSNMFTNKMLRARVVGGPNFTGKITTYEK